MCFSSVFYGYGLIRFRQMSLCLVRERHDHKKHKLVIFSGEDIIKSSKSFLEICAKAKQRRCPCPVFFGVIYILLTHHIQCVEAEIEQAIFTG